MPKNPWAKGLLAAAIALSVQAGPALAQGNREEPIEEQPAAKLIETARSYARKRDPFKLPPTPREAKEESFGDPLLPGKRGLVISHLRLLGIVSQVADQTMIAVVTNQTNRAYFLRIHDEVYNGVVSGITANSVRFKENRLERDGQMESREIVLKMTSPPEEGR